MLLNIDVPADHPELKAIAEGAWKEFLRTTRNPLDVSEVVFGTTLVDPGARALSRPSFRTGAGANEDESAEIILSQRLLEGSADEIRLSLLHECIHLAFAFGSHRARQVRIHALYEEHQQSVEASSTEASDRNFRQLRADTAFQFLGLPDEIVAELRLAAEYPELLHRRATYYIGMRREEVARLAERSAADPFTPFAYFFANLRASLYLPLVAAMSPEYNELVRLADWAAAGLARTATQEVFELCTSLRPSLLAVSLESPIDSSDAAYSRVFSAIMSVGR